MRLRFVHLLVAVTAAACYMPSGEPSAPQTTAPATAAPGPQAPALETTEIRRLSIREYVHVVKDLLGLDVVASRFLEETYATGYDNGTANLGVQEDQAFAFEQVANDLADLAIAGHASALLGPCDPVRDGEADCEAAFLQTFVPRAYRRPLTKTETNRLRTLFDDAAGGGFRAGLRTTLLAVLQSPSFLYRTEIGRPSELPSAGRTLDDYEIASALSFLFTGTMPDDELLAAAADGALANRDGRRAQALRLLSTPAAREQLRHFLDEWLGTDRLTDVVKDSHVYKLDANLLGSMRRELDLYFDDVLWNQDRSLGSLLTNDAGFVDGRLSTLYGAPPPAARDARIALGGERRGVLTRAGFLTTHASYDNSGPIARGVFVRSALLCASLPAPPPNVPRTVPADSAKTTRQRFEAHTANPFCQGCHRSIDGVGFGFEEFDGMGVYRTEENGVKVDASGELFDSGVDGPFVGASSLADLLARSPRVEECFVRQLFRFAMGRGEVGSDEAWLGEASAHGVMSAAMTGVLVDLVQDDRFVRRTEAPR